MTKRSVQFVLDLLLKFASMLQCTRQLMIARGLLYDQNSWHNQVIWIKVNLFILFWYQRTTKISSQVSEDIVEMEYYTIMALNTKVGGSSGKKIFFISLYCKPAVLD